ncbi:MAG TPA: hypothetical protein ENH10_04780 [Bacteroidetes bacterium]|nr:hypothetical protein BMS3Bbin04_00390 [bacterium BMS3Bbin04]HDO65331.1 hypothetical protein [Bacteroidota bacterium]HEX04456.1 hypothetical protein [Bacteroidota bacterium]
MRKSFVFSPIVCLVLAFSSSGTARSVESTLSDPHDIPHRVPQISGVVNADGVLDEDVWSEALVMSLDYEVRPGENVPPPVKTEVLIAYSESELLVAFKAYDPNPDEIRARMRDRDAIGSDDWVCINLDTFNDARRSFLLMCNPFGVQSDFIEVNGGNGSDWDTIWDSGGRIYDWGYAVEMVIPFSSLRFQHSAEDQIWGVDAIRSYPRNVRHHIGLFPRDRDNNCYLCQAVKLIGFAGADPGRSIEIDPTLSGILAQGREDGAYGPFADDSKDLNAGFTARWGVTPNLTLATTYNPDFSQIESDVFQLDVNSRFALYYREQRPFFLEGADIFNSHERLVHTRTVADPNWGAKLTGKEGRNGIGIFVAHDEYTSLLFPSAEGSESKSMDRDNTVGVIRYKRDVGESSYLGATVTDREAVDYGNRVGSVDGTFDLNQNDRLRFQMTGSWTEYPQDIQNDYDQDDEIFGESSHLQFVHGTRSWDSWLWGRRRNADFRADAGFMNQSDFTSYGAGSGWSWYGDADHWYSNITLGGDVEESRTYDNSRMLERQVSSWIRAQGSMQSYFNVSGKISREWYQEQEYNDDNIWIGGGFFPHPDFMLEMGVFWGKDIDYTNSQPATNFSLHPGFNWLMGKNFRIDVNHTYDQLDVHEGTLYAANISRVRLVYQFNRRMFVRTIIENVYIDFNKEVYDEPEEQDGVYQGIATQFLFSYTLNPQTVLYLGYSDNIQAYNKQPLAQSDRVFFFKMGYAWMV